MLRLLTNNIVREAVVSLLKGEQISVKGTRAVGCSLKWKRVEGVITGKGQNAELIYYRQLLSKESC